MLSLHKLPASSLEKGLTRQGDSGATPSRIDECSTVVYHHLQGGRELRRKMHRDKYATAKVMGGMTWMTTA